MSTVNVNTIKPITDDVHLSLQAGGSTRMLLTSAGSLSAQSLSATQFWGDGSKLCNLPGGGKVLQVVSTSSGSSFTTSSNDGSMEATGVTVSITPSSASSKIFVTGVIGSITTNNSNNIAGYGILRDGTQIGAGTSSGSRTVVHGGSVDHSGDNNEVSSKPFQFLDSPNSTSALVYQIAVLARSGQGNTYFNRTVNDSNNAYTLRPLSTITVMEISA